MDERNENLTSTRDDSIFSPELAGRPYIALPCSGCLLETAAAAAVYPNKNLDCVYAVEQQMFLSKFSSLCCRYSCCAHLFVYCLFVCYVYRETEKTIPFPFFFLICAIGSVAREMCTAFNLVRFMCDMEQFSRNPVYTF